MSISPKRKLAVGAAGLAVLAGTGGAYAATQQQAPGAANRPDPAAEQKAFLDDLAQRLNVPRDQPDAAIKGAADDRIDAAVSAGRLTKEQGDDLKQRLQNANRLPLLGVPGVKPFGPGPGPRFGRGFAPRGPDGDLDAAAKYLGLTERQLFDQLRDGKSLADVANARNKPVDGLKAAIKSALSDRLDQAVKDKKLTDAQRTKILADLDQRLDDMVNGRRPAGGPPFGFRHRGP